MEIDIDCDALKALNKLETIATRMQTIEPLFPKAKQYMRQANVSNFATNGLPVGGWAPLKPDYDRWKSSKFPGEPTLVRTGKLFRHLSSLNGPANRGKNLEMTFGLSPNEVKYAKFHQFGTSKMPKRQIIFAPPLFAKWLSDQYGDWFMNGTV